MAKTEDTEAPITVETQAKDAGVWEKSLDVTVPAPEVKHEFDAVVGELASQAVLPGFRRGKVPRDLLEKRFGADLQKQVTGNLLKRALQSALTKEKLDVVGEPILDVEKYKAVKGEPFTFNVTVEIRPAFELGNYKGLTLEQEEIEILPSELEQSLSQIRERFAELADAPPDHVLGDRDTARGPLRVSVDGKEVHNEEGQLLLMEGHVLGGYAHLGSKFLEGAKIGDKRTVEEVLNDQFPKAEYRGKKAAIEFEVKSVRMQQLPPLDDALAEKLGLKTLDELQQRVRSSLLEKIGDMTNARTRTALLDKVLETTPFELPKRLSETMTARTAQGHLQQLARLGVRPEMLGTSAETILAESKGRAAVEMRRFFVLEAICAKEGITVSEEDIDEEIVKQARQRNMRASQFYDQLVQEEGALLQLESDLKSRKALDYLVEQADIKIVPRKPPEKPQGHEHHDHAPKGAAPAGEAAPGAASGEVHEHAHEHEQEHTPEQPPAQQKE